MWFPRHEGNIYWNYVRSVISSYSAYGIYWFLQKNFVQAQYWHDPLQNDLYRTKSKFIADINNDRDVKNPV